MLSTANVHVAHVSRQVGSLIQIGTNQARQRLRIDLGVKRGSRPMDRELASRKLDSSAHC
jgi:hypothetical protein